MIDSTIRLVGGGNTVTLLDSADSLLRQPGGGGWGMAPVVNSWFEGAGDGARLRGTRRSQRNLKIPVTAFGLSRAQVETRLRQLTQTVHDPFTVFVDYDDGRSFWIEAVYEDGASGDYTSAPELYAEMPFVFKCPDPYWTSTDSQSFTVAPIPSEEPFLPELAGLHVGGATAFGTVTAANIGDLPARPTWTIHGPGVNPTISLGDMGFEFDVALLSTDIFTVQFIDGVWTVTDQTGANRYGDLQPAPWFPEFPRGAFTVSASMASTGPESFIRAIYPERREVVY